MCDSSTHIYNHSQSKYNTSLAETVLQTSNVYYILLVDIFIKSTQLSFMS